MTLWRIAWSYLWSRKTPTVITMLSVALGVALISSVLTLRAETQRRFEEEGQAFDLVVGGKGSRIQLVLSAVYFLDAPTGNVAYSVYEELKRNDDVAAAYPIGLGDTYQQFRVVGTSRELFDYTWTNVATGETRDPFVLAEGAYFEKPFEAVLGATAAEQTGLKVGDQFFTTHGMTAGSGDECERVPYTVVGILKPGDSPFDRALYCTLDSVWHAHGMATEGGHAAHESGEQEAEAAHGAEAHANEAHGAEEGQDEREVTAVLVQLKTPGLRFQFKDYVNGEMNAMAAIPVIEIQQLYKQILGTAKTILLAVGYLVVVVSAMSIMASLYLSILQRRRDLAIMRALGASTAEIFGAVLLEAFWVTVLGIGAGWLLGNLVSSGLGLYLSYRFGMGISAFGLRAEEVRAFAIVAIVGMLSGVLPAWQAYQTDVAKNLSEP